MENNQQGEKNLINQPAQIIEKPKTNFFIIILITFFFVIISGLIYVVLSNRKLNNNKQPFNSINSSKITQSSPPENTTSNILCPLIDGQANIIDANKTYLQKDLIPLESRIASSFRFSNDSILFFKYYPGYNNSIYGEKGSGFDTATGVNIPHITYPDKKNANFFIDQLSLPQIFNPNHINPPPLYSDFFGMSQIVGINNKF